MSRKPDLPRGGGTLPDRLDAFRPARRVVSVWFRNFSVNISVKRLPKLKETPLILIQHEAGRSWIIGADAAAQALGIAPGQALADARALYPDLDTREADFDTDRREFDTLADWCGRYTPWVGIDAAVA